MRSYEIVLLLIIVVGAAVIMKMRINQSNPVNRDNLSKQENELLNQIGFNKEVFQIMKTGFKSEIFEVQPKDSEGNSKIRGVYFKIKGDSIVYSKVMAIKEELKKMGYIIFISDLGYSENPYKICVIKGDDKYDPLRFMATNGINYDHDTKDVIEKLREWDQAYGIEIISAGFDFVEAELSHSPEDIKAFAKEVYEYCPDSVDQGVGTIEELEEYILDTSRVYMWWD